MPSRKKPGGKGGKGAPAAEVAEAAAAPPSFVEGPAKGSSGPGKAVAAAEVVPTPVTLPATAANVAVKDEAAGNLECANGSAQTNGAVCISGEAPCKDNIVEAAKIDATPHNANPFPAASSGEAPCAESAPVLATSSQSTSGVAPSLGEALSNEEPEVCSAQHVSDREPLCGGGSGEAPMQEQNSAPREESQASVLPNVAQETPENVGSSAEAPQVEAPETKVEAAAKATLETPEQVGSSGEAPQEVEASETSGQADTSGKAPESAAVNAEVLHGGGSGEAPLREEPEVVEPATDTSSRDATAEELASSTLSGDYHFSNPDDGVQCVLRLRPNGQWWHATHRSSTERARILEGSARQAKVSEAVNIHKAYKDYDFEEKVQDLSQLDGNYEQFEVWETAETIGTWREVQVLSEAMKASGSAPMSGVLLTCENCTWHSNYQNATLTYRPQKDDEDEVYSMIDEGQLVLCFVLQESGGKNLELHMDLSSVSEKTGGEMQNIPKHSQTNLQTAFQTLGFARAYVQGQPSNLQDARSSSARTGRQPSNLQDASEATLCSIL